MVAGAPFFFTDGEGDGVALGGSLAPGVSLGVAEGVGDSASVGVGEGEDLCFFFGEALGEEAGAGVGEVFFFFGEAEALGSGFSAGVGLPDAFFCFEEDGDGDFSGVTDSFGVGDFSASSFFFGAVEPLRCFRGIGVGVGAKIFLILLPTDSSACVSLAVPKSISIKIRAPAILLARRMERERSTTARDESHAAGYHPEPRRRRGISNLQSRRGEKIMRDAMCASCITRWRLSNCEVPRRLRGLG